MTVGEAVDVQAGGAGQRPGELGEADQYVTDGDVGAQAPRGHGARHEPFDSLFEAAALGEQFGMVLSKPPDSIGQSAPMRSSAAACTKRQSAAKGSASSATASSARSVVREVTERTTSWVSAARSGKFR